MKRPASRSKSKRSTSSHETPSLDWGEVTPDGRVSWASGGAETVEKGRPSLPAQRCYVYDAEQWALRYWTDPEAGARVGTAWFAGEGIVTVQAGSSYVHSASRWLPSPPDSLEQLGELVQGVGKLCRDLNVKFAAGPGGIARGLYRRQGRSWGRPDSDLNAWCEPGAYGGRVELLVDPGELPGPLYQYDRRQAYLSHLLHDEIPLASSARWEPRLDLRGHGLVEAIVEADEETCFFPVLPCRVATLGGGSRTLYPWGRFWGRWTCRELAAARDRGYRVRQLGGFSFTNATHRGEFHRYALAVAEASRSWALAKRLGPALVGKLLTGRVHRVAVPFGEGLEGEALADAWRKLPPGSVLVRGAPVALVLKKQESFPPDTDMVAGIHVLSSARLELLKAMEAAPLTAVAVATDGLISRAPVDLPSGEGVGEWRLDYTADLGGRILAATTYELRSSLEKEPVKRRSAGIHRALAAKFLAGETVRVATRLGIRSHDPGRRVDLPKRARAGHQTGNAWVRCVKTREGYLNVFDRAKSAGEGA